MSGSGSGNECGADTSEEDLAVFQSRLRRLKREGCNLLVVGDVPRELFTRASESMLGDADARRWRVFGLTDATPESVRDRLPSAEVAPRPRSETTKIVTHAVGSQRTADTAAPDNLTADTAAYDNLTPDTTAPDTPTADTTAPETTVLGEAIPEVDVSDADLEAFRRELVSALDAFGVRSHRPASVRLSVDSLVPLLDRYDREAVRRFLRAVTDRVHDRDAMAHYVLPVAYDSDTCQGLVEEFDAVVELRTTIECATDSSGDSPRPHRAEERWHLPESDATMPWVPL
ncbi:DUF7504 family protein [Halorussus ruber]|uniref:DUF7504 family protein n=1 Tax=Halorussus ruber TaxID=1126238 RepID=UPI00143CC63E|nr:hypothetical protein [Halorussus ruber]